MAPDLPIRRQPLRSRGDIIIEDEVWPGYGVIVLDGVRIGHGAVVGAGSVVVHDIPLGVVAQGVPARAIRQLRLGLGMSVRALAAKTGFSPSFISQTENSQVTPSIGSLERIAMALGVSLGKFFAEPETSAVYLVVTSFFAH